MKFYLFLKNILDVLPTSLQFVSGLMVDWFF